jgi:excisionase family DNA binding protein
MTGRPLTARDVAERYGFSVDTILRWTRENKLPAHRISGTPRGRLRWFEDELDALDAERATGATPAREVSAAQSDVADVRLQSSSSAVPPRLAVAPTEEEPPDATP